MYNNIFFDLDGTLTDPGQGITNSVLPMLLKNSELKLKTKKNFINS